MAETYIFRFRDFGKSYGYTVDEHNLISLEHKHVWWGWWAKSGESFPKHDLELAIERNPEFSIFLFDTGQSKFYSAILYNVDASASGETRKAAPDNGLLTPKYYRHDQLLGWLKLGEIKEIGPEKVLKSYTYLPLHRMYPEGSNDPDEQLFNKKVFSSIELKKQDRTIWKVRPSISYDLEHESLATHYTPYNYVKKHSVKEADFILWTSDIHFDNDSGNHNFPTEDSDQHKCLSTRITQLVQNFNSTNKAAALAISGDITWCSQDEGFKKAEKFINDLSSVQTLTPDDLILCPGNHDVGLVNREEYYQYTGDEPEAKDDWQKLATEYHRKHKQNYVNFYKKIFLREPEDNLSQGRKFLLNGHKVVEFASLNSCLLQQVQNQFQGIGYVGEAQLNSMATNLGWSNNEGVKIPKKNGVIRIAMLHHHLTPVNEVEDALLDVRYSVTLDAERIMRWIVKHKVDYVLHGHMHKCNSITITRKVDSLQPTSSENPEHTFKIISLGSSGVKYEDLPGQDSANYVGVIDFSGEKPSFKFFKLNKQTEPETSPTYTVEG